MTKKSEISPAEGIKKIKGILDNAIATKFKGDLPDRRYLPEFESLPKLDRELCKLEWSDAKNARRLKSRFGKNLMYLIGLGWAAWTGKFWSFQYGEDRAYLYAEKTSDAMKGEVEAVCVQGKRADESEDKFKDRLKAYYRWAVNSANSPRMNAMVNHAARLLPATTEDLDTHPYLLNLQNGTLNLKATDNGEEDFRGIVLQKHRRGDKITKMANISYDPEAPYEEFEKFIRQILPDDEVRFFVQRYFGYCLTGSTKEQVILMLWGEGSNGKSTLVELIDWLLGDYALVTPFASLLHTDTRRGSEPTPDLARMPGARFVSAAEPDTGARFAESMLKQLTGGENMTVRHLRQDFFEFRPQFKLCISFNKKPYIKGEDDGIWRRIALVQFKQQFFDPKKAKRTPGALPKVLGLEETLRDEANGIFNWILDGYRMWLEKGLDIPEAVRLATDEYRHESNRAYPFIEAWCERVPNGSIQATRAYIAYELWCKENAEDPVKQTTFGKHMTMAKVEKEKDKTTRTIFYKGIQLNPEAESRVQDRESNDYRNKGVPND